MADTTTQGGAQRRKPMQLPGADDVVRVDAPKADAATTSSTEAARAERASQIAVGGKAPKTEAKPGFVADATKIADLQKLSLDELLAKATESGVQAAALGDRRIFMWTGVTVDGLRGQPVDRSKIRSAVVNLLKSVGADHPWAVKTEAVDVLKLARATKRDHVTGNAEEGHHLLHTLEGRVIHAFMFLAGSEVHGGKYDIGYIATRRGENKSRGMVARGYLAILGDSTPPAVVAAEIKAEAEVDPAVAEKE